MYDQIAMPAISGKDQVNLQQSGRLAGLRPGASLSSAALIDTVDPVLQHEYAEQANLQLEQKIGSITMLTASYEYVRGVEIPEAFSRVTAICESAAQCGESNRQYASGQSSAYDRVTIAFEQHPVQWGTYRISYTSATAQSSFDANSASLSDQNRGVALMASLHTALSPGTTLWQRFSHGFTLTSDGAITSRSDLPGFDFINLSARLTRSVQIGNFARLEGFVSACNTIDRRTYSMNAARADLGERAAALLSTYQSFAALTTPNATQLGFRLKF
jgi:hypothetical protein